ncbi:MAG: SurA N-terminal domain-containing protein [Desulfovibrionaceae bacterium]
MARKIALRVVLLLLVLGAAAPALAEDVFRIVAVVNTTPITDYDLRDRLEKMLSQLNIQLESQGKPTITMDTLLSETGIQDKILDQLIDDLLLKQEIDRLHLDLSDKELDERIADIKSSEGLSEQGYQERLKSSGYTDKTFREDMRWDLLKHRLIINAVGKKIVVTDSEVQDEIAKRGLGGSGRMVRLSYILLPQGQDPKELRGRIDSGKLTFAEAADTLSVGPGVGQGGDLGFLAVADLAPDWQKAIQDLDQGKVSEPFQVNDQWALIEITEEKTSEVTVDEATRTGVFNDLREAKFQKTLKDYLDRLKENALIERKTQS